MNKPVYLGLSILQISKIVLYEFWYDHVKPKYGGKAKLGYMDTGNQYGGKAKLGYMDTGNLIVYIKIEDIYSDIAKDVETRYDTSNYKLDRPLPKGKNKQVIGLIKDELSRKIIREFAVLQAKTYSYLTDNHKDQKSQRHKT